MTHTPAHEAGAGLSPPLWQQLQACAKALRHVRQGRNHVQALAVVSPAMRPAAQALLFAVLRQWGCTLAVQKALVQRAPPAAVDDLLCIGLALALPANQAMYPMHTLVNQLVEAAKRDPSTRAQAAFINACVRRFDRERATWAKRCESQLSARWNHPDWWVKAVQQDHPMHWQAVLSASQQAAPMAVRVNRRQHSADALQALWQSQGVASDRCGPDGLVLHQPQAVHALPGFEQGWFSVQDPGAQMAAPLLLTGLQPSDGPRLRVLDACAAPGARRHICSNWRMWICWQSMWKKPGVSGYVKICSVCNSRPKCGVPMWHVSSIGGTVDPGMPFCWTHLARPQALCADTQTYLGCVGRPTWQRWPTDKNVYCKRCGPASDAAAACYIAPVHCFVRKGSGRFNRSL